MSALEEELYEDLAYEEAEGMFDLYDEDFEMLIDQEFFDEAIVPPTDTRKKIRKSRMKSAPYRYIVNLEYHFPVEGKITMGTGVLIGPRTVLTAGHNLDISSFKKNRMYVTPARFGVGYSPFGTTKLTGFHRPANYRNSTPTDLALLYLNKPLGNKAGFWSVDYKKYAFDKRGASFIKKGPIAYPGNFKVNLIGYSGDKPKNLRFGCRLSGSGCQVAPVSSSVQRICGTFQYGSYEDSKRFVKDASGRKLGGHSLRLLTYENDTCQVNSGSPIYVKRHSSKGGRVLYGIHIRTFRNSSGKVIENGAVYILPWLNYIKSRVK